MSNRTTPTQRLAVSGAIRERRSIREFEDRPVPRASLERMVEAARWAPNHRLTSPWRIYVLEKDSPARERVAELTRTWTHENNPQLPEPKLSQVADGAKAEVLNAPALILTYSVPGANEEVTRENYASACIAVQNMALTALEEGLSSGWSTGRSTKHPDLPATLGADPSWQMVGALFIGYSTAQPRANRPDVSTYAFWK